ncbi:MAG: hypothetical protein AB7S38_27700 [Vulcanimicrobiota bacterium]
MVISGVNGATPANLRPSPRAAATGPTDGYEGSARPLEASLYRATAGGFEQVHQQPLGRFDRLLFTGQNFVKLGEKTITGWSRQGEKLYEFERTPDFVSLECEQHSGRVFVLEKGRLQSLDGQTGQPTAELNLPFEATRLDVNENGLVVGGPDRLLVTDSRLDSTREVTPKSYDNMSRALLLPDGKLVVTGRSLEVLGSDGQTIYQQDASPTYTHYGADRLTFRQDKQLTSLDLATGASRSFAVSDDIQDILPRPDGSVLVREHHDYTKSTFRLYSPDGEKLKKFTFRGSVEEVRLSRDGNEAYVAGRRWHQEPKARLLLRIDLDQAQTGWGLITHSVGLADHPVEIYSEPDDRPMFHFAPLADGRLAIVSSNGPIALDRDGNPSPVSLDAPLLADPNLGHYHRHPTLEGYLREFQHHNDKVSLKPTLWSLGGVLADGCAQFAEPSTQDQALTQAGVSASTLSSKLLASSKTAQVAVFPDLSDARVRWGRVPEDFDHFLTIELPAGRPNEFKRTTFWTDDGQPFTEVLPLRAGDDYLAVAGSASGHVYVMQPGQPVSAYKLDSAVAELVATKEGKVLAMGANGGTLVIDLGRPLKVGEALIDSTDKDQRIIVSDDQVTIGDFSLDVHD